MKVYSSCFLVLSAIFLPITSVEGKTGKNPNDEFGRYKSIGPIEINSDSLEVLQRDNKAIFTGHVVALQGDVKLKSEKMTVFYKSKANPDAKKPTKDKSPTSAISGKTSIEKIVVEKKVLLTTPEETASGAGGVYDVVGQKIFLNDDVVLTRGKNVLKGNRLVYDFTTGKSVMNSSADSTGNNKTKQRVKALFVPDKNDDKALPSKK